jgi:hypothetical protein
MPLPGFQVPRKAFLYGDPMKIFGCVLALFIFSQSSFAFECQFDRRAADGGAANIQMTKNDDGSYRVALSKSSARPPYTESALYENAQCSVSKTNPFLMYCLAPVNVGYVSASLEIETQISYGAFGDTLSVVLDSSGTFEREIGVQPGIKIVSAPLDSCKSTN